MHLRNMITEFSMSSVPQPTNPSSWSNMALIYNWHMLKSVGKNQRAVQSRGQKDPQEIYGEQQQDPDVPQWPHTKEAEAGNKT